MLLQDDLSSHPLLDMPWPACWRSDTNGNYPEASEEGLVREYEVDSVDSGDVLTERGQGGQHWDPNIGSLLRRPLLEEGVLCVMLSQYVFTVLARNTGPR